MDKLYFTSTVRNKITYFILLILLVAGAYLRFYRIYDFATFLGDQGRDALIVRDIATLKHFTAIGAPTSIGDIFLGPFFYYLMAPFLLIFRFNPAGMAAGTGIIALIGIIAAFVTIKKEFGHIIALTTSIFVLFSGTLIDLSRYAWNPNPLPYFAFFTLFFLTAALQSEQLFFGFLFGSFMSLSIQLHYLALLLMIPSLLIWLVMFLKKDHKITYLKQFGMAIIGFIVFISPLIIFDLKHQFINSKNFLTFISKGETAEVSPYINRLQETLLHFVNYITGMTPDPRMIWWISGLLLVMLYLLFRRSRSLTLRIHILSFIMYLFLFAAINTQRHYHYYTSIYLTSYFLLAVICVLFIKNKLISALITITVLSMFLYWNIPKYYFFFSDPNKQIEHAKNVATVIHQDVASNQFKMTALPDIYSDSTYRYFIIVLGSEPVDKNSFDKVNLLYVVCEQTCTPIGDGQWDIAYFAPTKVAKTWKVDGATVYKLTH